MYIFTNTLYARSIFTNTLYARSIIYYRMKKMKRIKMRRMRMRMKETGWINKNQY